MSNVKEIKVFVVPVGGVDVEVKLPAGADAKDALEAVSIASEGMSCRIIGADGSARPASADSVLRDGDRLVASQAVKNG
jgi:hypothetical protein